MSRVLDKLAVNATRMTRLACFGALVAMFVAISPATSSAQSAPSSGLDVPTTKLLAIGPSQPKGRRTSGSRSFLLKCATPYGSISLGESTNGTSSRTRAVSCS